MCDSRWHRASELLKTENTRLIAKVYAKSANGVPAREPWSVSITFDMPSCDIHVLVYQVLANPNEISYCSPSPGGDYDPLAIDLPVGASSHTLNYAANVLLAKTMVV